MSTTTVDVTRRGDTVSCALSGGLVIPRLVRRSGSTVEIALVAGGAMLLPGDEVRIDIRIDAGCTLGLVDIGGLIVYGRPGSQDAPSHWHARLEIGTGAHLRWNGLPTVITDAGALERSLRVQLAEQASMLLRETLVLGRDGERGGRVVSETDVVDTTGPLLRETLTVAGTDPVPGVLGTRRITDSIFALGTPEMPEPDGADRLVLERGGSIIRWLGDHAHASPLTDTWSATTTQMDTAPQAA